MKIRKLGLLVSVVGALLGFGSAVHAQWTESFTEMGVIYTLSDLTTDPSATTHSYSLVLNTTGYTGPSGAFLDSVNIKAWDGGSSNMSFTLLSAPGATSWSPTEGSISSGPVSNTGCGSTGSGYACVEADTKGVLSVSSGNPYTFVFSVEALSASSFFSSPHGAYVGAGYANSSGRGASYGITDVTMVPEPEIYAMLAAGLGLMGFVARRRKQQLVAAA